MCVYMYTDVYTHTRKTKPLSWCFAQYWCACVGGRSAVGWQTKTTNQQTLITHAHKPPIRTHTHTHTLAHKYAVVCDIIFCDVIPYWRFGIWYPPKGSYAKPLPRAVIFIQNRFRSQKRCSYRSWLNQEWPVWLSAVHIATTELLSLCLRRTYLSARIMKNNKVLMYIYTYTYTYTYIYIYVCMYIYIYSSIMTLHTMFLGTLVLPLWSWALSLNSIRSLSFFLSFSLSLSLSLSLSAFGATIRFQGSQKRHRGHDAWIRNDERKGGY